MNFSRVLQEIRDNNNLTQLQLANILKVSRSTVTNWENGLSNPPDEIKVKLTQNFNISLDYIFGLNTSKNKEYNELQKKMETLTTQQYKIIKNLIDELVELNNK